MPISWSKDSNEKSKIKTVMLMLMLIGRSRQPAQVAHGGGAPTKNGEN